MRLPGLHSIHWKVFVFHLAVLIVPLIYISSKVRTSIETSYLHSTEEGMIDTAAVVSELYARLYGQFGADSEKVAAELSRVYSNLNQTYEIKAPLFWFHESGGRYARPCLRSGRSRYFRHERPDDKPGLLEIGRCSRGTERPVR